MSGRRSYLDYNATSPVRPEVIEVIAAVMRETGNASSVHGEGRRARARLETARRQVAALVGGPAQGVIFTSGGSEANVTALSPLIIAGRRTVTLERLYVSAVEHPSVLEGGRFGTGGVHCIPVDENGLVDRDWLAARLAEDAAAGRGALVSIMLANNETGIVQPLAEIAPLIREAGAYLHTDAVQAVGRLPVEIGALGADFLTLSAHKLGGPQGVGAIVLRDPQVAPLPLLSGGGQEMRHRAGTEAVALIAGFGRAAEIAGETATGDGERIASLRAFLEAEITRISPEAVILGKARPRLPNTVCFARPGFDAETLVIAFDLEGVALSAGAACASGKVAASHVVQAMGYGRDVARAALRVSLGWASDETDVAHFSDAWRTIHSRLGRLRAGRAA